MASQTVSCSSGSSTNFEKTARLRVDYTAGGGSITITGLAGYRQYARSHNASNTSVTIYFNGSAQTCNLQHYVDFGYGKYIEWYPYSVSSSGHSGNVTVMIKMPSSNAQFSNREFTLTIDAGTSVYTPVINTPSVNNIKANTVNAAFTVADNGGAAIQDHYMDISLTNFGTVVGTISDSSGIFSGLEPVTTYYLRANASNGTYRGYSPVTSFKTKGEPPKNLSIDNLRSTWVSSAEGICIQGDLYAEPGIGSGDITNYTVYYKRAIDSNYSTKNFGTSPDMKLTNLQDDTQYNIYFTATSDCGTTTSQTYTYKAASVNFVKVSVNGGAFTKRRMYFNQSDGEWYLAYSENVHVIRGI